MQKTTANMTLKKYRKSLSLTQLQMADKIGIAQPTYSAIESGKQKPGADIIIKLAKALQVDIGYSHKTGQLKIDAEDIIIDDADTWYNDLVYANIVDGTWHLSRTQLPGYMETTYAIATSANQDILAEKIQHYIIICRRCGSDSIPSIAYSDAYVAEDDGSKKIHPGQGDIIACRKCIGCGHSWN